MTFDRSYTLPSKRHWASFEMSTAANGQSDTLDFAGATLAGLRMPSAWDAADLTFLASPDGAVSYASVYGSTGDEITYTVAAERVVTFDPAFWLGVQYLVIRSGTFAAPVAQTTTRTFYACLQALGTIR